jgi:dTDP-glucose pyrophosphorylase
MNILITMAGKGSRFKQKGIETPKHKLDIDGRPMFNYAMSSLRSFFDCRFIFITRDGVDDSEFIINQCTELGIEEYSIHEIDELTDGQATTALHADSIIDDSTPVAIYNIDTYVEPDQIRQEDIQGDGWIPVFNAPGEQWSFADVADDGTVREVAEKERISDLATVGFYHFAEWRLFKRAYEEFGDTVKRRYGEKYICPMYQWLINNSEEVMATKIDSDAVHVLGTPEDVVAFAPDFADKHNLCI